jgi:uncharacterized protein
MRVRMQSLNTGTITPEMEQIRQMIMETVKERESLKQEMEYWYTNFPGNHFPKMQQLMFTDTTLSKLDSHYKQLWDYHNAKHA